MSDAISPNARRWLNMISFAEGTWGGSAPRYDVTFGYKPIKDLSRHPNQVVRGDGYSSAAAGAYQFMPSTWAGVAKKRGLKDFGPTSQDIAALELIRARGVDPERDPITPQTVAKLSGEWASLPTLQGKSAYGQPVKSFEALRQFAEKQGAGRPRQAEESTASRLSFLNKFIDLLGVTGGLKQFGPQSSLPTPALPDYSDEEVSSDSPEAGLLLSLYGSQRDTGEIEKALSQKSSDEVQRNMEAMERAKATLLAQALGSFNAPKSVI